MLLLYPRLRVERSSEGREFLQLQEDERELRRKGKYKEEELHDLETEVLEQETQVRFEGVALALEEMIAGGEVKEEKEYAL